MVATLSTTPKNLPQAIAEVEFLLTLAGHDGGIVASVLCNRRSAERRATGATDPSYGMLLQALSAVTRNPSFRWM